MKKKPKAALGDRYDVILTDGGDQKIEVARVVQEITGRHRVAAELTELFSCPTPIVEGVTEDLAKKVNVASRKPTAPRRSRPRAVNRWRKRQSLVVFRRWVEFHRQVLGFTPSWESYAC